MLFHACTSRISITDAGHSREHFPQPIHASRFIFATIPFQISIASRGHTFLQQPHATQLSSSTNAFRLFLIFPVFVVIYSLLKLMDQEYQILSLLSVMISHKQKNCRIRDKHHRYGSPLLLSLFFFFQRHSLTPEPASALPQAYLSPPEPLQDLFQE